MASTSMLSQDPNDGVPTFEVDPLFPKNLPNHWLMGPTIGVDVDSRDHIWVVHRNTPDNFVLNTEIGMTADPPVAQCCQPGPPILEFDQEAAADAGALRGFRLGQAQHAARGAHGLAEFLRAFDEDQAEGQGLRGWISADRHGASRDEMFPIGNFLILWALREGHKKRCERATK